jgi:uncharacterized membrane protein YhaH (DUF805 family)
VAGLVLGMIPLLGFLIGLALIYPNVCVGAKRLHDMGKTGWLMLIPYGSFLIACILAVVFMVMGAAGAAMTDSAGLGIAAIVGAALLPFGLAFLINIAFLIWIGVTPGQPGPNQYGAPSTSVIEPPPSAPPPAV